jgi:transcription-repair coupling factor (superfamily II helicase)
MALNTNQLKGIFSSKLSGINLDQNQWFKGLNGSALSFVIQSLTGDDDKNCIVVASDKESAAYIFNDLETMCGEKKVLFFPESYKQPYQIEKTTNANIQERAEALNLLSKANLKVLLVTYPQAISEKVTLKKQLSQNNDLEVKHIKGFKKY